LLPPKMLPELCVRAAGRTKAPLLLLLWWLRVLRAGEWARWLWPL
jgi:hypothetical protein